MTVIQTRIPRLHEQLDGKEAWDAILQYGSLGKAIRMFKVNPHTQRRYSKMGISRAAYKWALEHLPEVKPQWTRLMIEAGLHPTEDAWKEWLRDKARVAYYYKVEIYEQFVADNGL